MDQELRKLNAAAIPSALDALDDRILAALTLRAREAAAMRRIMAVAALVSLGGGMVAGGAFAPATAVANPLTPFGPLDPLTSSTMGDMGE